MTEPTPHRVLIAGGGVAGLEAMIALRCLAGDRVSVTLLAPEHEFVLRALSVQDPFARPTPRHYDLAAMCADHGAAFVRDALESVEPTAHAVTTRSGARLAYDDLIVAVGAHPQRVFSSSLTFTGLDDVEAVHGLVQDVEGGYTRRIAFVVPPGVSWPLPLYELALMTAERASGLGLDVDVQIVTPEPAPLAIFGRRAGEAIGRLLEDAGIVVHTDTFVADVRDGDVVLHDGGSVVQAERVVALPRLIGPAVPGLPADADGFVRIDDHGAVPGTPGVWAAGDGTRFPLKQGGIAAQLADTIAHAIAARLGRDVDAPPFRPRLRAKLLTGGRPKYLSEMITGGWGDASSTAVDEPLWWPPTKVAAPHLGPYLDRLDAGCPQAAGGAAAGTTSTGRFARRTSSRVTLP
jgi:sulfide:quinone oxidoreductase